jgi:heterodisulfide reductase subunit B
MVLKLSRKLLDMAKMVEADAMVTMCPMCQANLDTRQADISQTNPDNCIKFPFSM